MAGFYGATQDVEGRWQSDDYTPETSESYESGFTTPADVPLLNQRKQDHSGASFQERLLRVTLLLVGLPAISCMWITQNHTSVTYWMGTSGFVVPAVACIWVAFAQSLITRSSVNQRCATIVALVLPVASLMLVAHYHKVMALEASTKLRMMDCVSFPGKVRLDRAWKAAYDVRRHCVAEQAELAGTSVKEADILTPVSACHAYQDERAKWREEWDYLQSLEVEQHCAGWCTMSDPLWQSFVKKTHHDRCSLVAAEVLAGTVYRSVRQLEIYCFCVLVAISLTAPTLGRRR